MQTFWSLGGQYMSAPVSEAYQLFFHEQKKPNIQELTDTTGSLLLKVHEMIPHFPKQWSQIGEQTPLGSLFLEPMFISELFRDFWLSQIAEQALKHLETLIEQDLALRLAQVANSSLLVRTKLQYIYSSDAIYEYLKTFFTDFEGSEKIENARKKILSEVPISQLIEKGLNLQKKQPSFINIEERSNEISLFLLDLDIHNMTYPQNDTEHLEIIQKKLKTFEIKVNHPCSQNVHLLENHRREIIELQDLGKHEIKGPKKTDLTPKDPSLSGIMQKADKIGLHISPHKAQTIKLSAIGASAALHTAELSGGWFGIMIGGMGLTTDAVRFIQSAFKLRMDLATIRHKQIMKGMKKLAKGQRVIVANQNVIFHKLEEINKNFDSITLNQKVIAEQLDNTIEIIYLTYQKTTQSLALLTHEVKMVRMALDTILEEKGKMCREARFNLYTSPGYNLQFNRFISFADFHRYYNQEKQSLKIGLEGLRSILMQPGSNEGYLVINPESKADEITLFSHFQNIWKFYLEKTKDWNSKKQFGYLLNPPSNVNNVDKYLESYSSSKDQVLPVWLSKYFTQPLENLIKRPYNFNKVIDYSESARCFHYFYGLLEDFPGSPPIKPENLESHEGNYEGIRLLQSTYIRLQIAILQANLFSGNGIVPFLYQASKKGEKKKVRELLAPNRLLSQNYMIYAFNKTLEDKKTSPNDYHLAYNSVEHQNFLTNLFGNSWEFVWDDESKLYGVSFNKEYAPVTLPTPESIINGRFEIHSNMGSLITLRSKILRELAGYHSGDFSLPEKVKENYQRGLLLTSILFNKYTEHKKGDVHGNSSFTTAKL